MMRKIPKEEILQACGGLERVKAAFYERPDIAALSKAEAAAKWEIHRIHMGKFLDVLEKIPGEIVEVCKP